MKRQRVKKCPLLLSVGAFLAVLFFLLHGAVYTASADTEGEFTYTVSNGETAITGYTGAGDEVVIPDTLGGYPVTSIGDGAFCYCSSLTSITIPDSVTSIGDYAFQYCHSLTSITIPGSVTSIGDSAFSGCSSLTSIEVAEENIAYASVDGVLFNKAQTVLFVYPRQKAGDYVVPDSVTSIGDGAFQNCGNLTSITLPDSLLSINPDLFIWCYNLAYIEVSESHPIYSGVDGVLFNKDQTELILCPGGKRGSYIIPDGVTSIGDYAFYDCYSLTSIMIPGSVTSIGRDVCNYNLILIKFQGSAPAVHENAFSNVTAIVIYPDDDDTWTEDVRRSYGENITWATQLAWITRSGSTYYIDADGSLHTGWLTEDGKRYYFDESEYGNGRLWKDRWKKSGDEWYLLGSDGAALTGWQDYLERRYYFDENGVLLTGQQEIDGEGYLFDKYGILQTDDLPEETIPLGERYVRIFYRYNDTYGWYDLVTEVVSFQKEPLSEYYTEVGEEEYIAWTPDAGSFSMGRSSFSPEDLTGDGSFAVEFLENTYYSYGGNGDGGIGYVQRGNKIYVDYYDMFEVSEDGQKLLEKDSYSYDDRIYLYGDATTYWRDDIESVSVSGGKSVYQIGEEVDVSALIMETTYTSGLTYIEKNSYSLFTVDYDFSTPGEKTVTVTYGTETAAFTTTILPALNFTSASLTLQNNLKVNFWVDKTFFTEVGYTSPYVVFMLNGAETVVSNYTEKDDCFIFSLADITPAQMNDTITATLYATYGDALCHSTELTYRVTQYCYNMLSDSDSSAKLRTLLVDLLRYGAAAQRYTGHNTAALADAMLTAEQAAWGTQSDPALTSVTNPSYATISQPEITWEAAGLRLGNGVTMQLYFTAESVEGLTIRIADENGKALKDLGQGNFVMAAGYYLASYRGINAGQLSDTVYITAYRGGVPVSNTLAYSVESYAYAKQNDGNAELAALVKALMNYGNAARAYAQ